MDFFDELGERIASTSRFAGEKARVVADVAKLNAQLGKEEYRLRKAYYALGKFYYENADAEADVIEPYIAAITDSKDIIASLKQQIEEAKNK
ncbi:MAG: hypothetical protein IJM37_10940 [Lachnospiraceae bacterium]|nr:hypothetical protein [Lachnospiraceae bacterium]MBQ9887354.1 hypothetical protein [Lachnospiraceae bacterium]